MAAVVVVVVIVAGLGLLRFGPDLSFSVHKVSSFLVESSKTFFSQEYIDLA